MRERLGNLLLMVVIAPVVGAVVVLADLGLALWGLPSGIRWLLRGEADHDA